MDDSPLDIFGQVSCHSEPEDPDSLTWMQFPHRIVKNHLGSPRPHCKDIPDLIANPFEISREYVQIIESQTSSPRLDKVLHGS
ncbi:hypothetical protein BS47DRAFT_1344219 [Hydnum rufescens UP504]|uniref:Uncharacterized protein n=1 Tax=Hydnum rufescens UP504 TaxID=1448309 RepID=A0A9P6AX55_9AGAM|nr:hypothetical protein BS47DRAFT_1344219 [Hydnum rufescens UP504]